MSGKYLFADKANTPGIMEDMQTITTADLPYTAEGGQIILGLQCLATAEVTVLTNHEGAARALTLVANVIYPVQLREITTAPADTTINVFLGALIV